MSRGPVVHGPVVLPHQHFVPVDSQRVFRSAESTQATIFFFNHGSVSSGLGWSNRVSQLDRMTERECEKTKRPKPLDRRPTLTRFRVTGFRLLTSDV